MKYSITPERYLNSIEPPFYPCDVQDANGNVVMGPNGTDPKIVYFDTETGVVIQLATNPDGTTKYYQSFGSMGVVDIIEVYPAPLTVIPLQPVAPSHIVSGS